MPKKTAKQKRRERAVKKSPRKSELSQRKIAKGEILSPYHVMQDKMAYASWRDNRFPEMLWAAILQELLDRDSYLQCFREVSDWWSKHDKSVIHAGSTAGHSYLKLYGPDLTFEFAHFLLERLDPPEVLRPLLLIGNLPLYEVWKSAIGMTPDLEDWDILKRAVMPSFDHQSEKSTDLRWLRTVTMMLTKKLLFPEGSDSPIKLIKFPNEFDQRSVRPMIRSTEGCLHQLDDCPENWGPDFWDYVYEITSRSPASIGYAEQKTVPGHSIDELRSRLDFLISKSETTRKSAIDDKHDVVFGLAILTLRVSLDICQQDQHQSILGLMGLRMCVENLVNLAYITTSNDHKIYEKFKQYGQGQANLIRLKLDDRDLSSHCIDPEIMTIFTNEQMSEVFRNIKLGDWCNKDLRKRSSNTIAKTYYDKLYDYTSAFSHGNWLSVAAVAYQNDTNPLHRLQRIPKKESSVFLSVESELLKVTEEIIAIVNSIYD